MKYSSIDLPLRLELLLALAAVALSAILTYIGLGLLSYAVSSAMEEMTASITGNAGAHPASFAPLIDSAFPFVWIALFLRVYSTFRRMAKRVFHSAAF